MLPVHASSSEPLPATPLDKIPLINAFWEFLLNHLQNHLWPAQAALKHQRPEGLNKRWCFLPIPETGSPRSGCHAGRLLLRAFCWLAAFSVSSPGGEGARGLFLFLEGRQSRREGPTLLTSLFEPSGIPPKASVPQGLRALTHGFGGRHSVQNTGYRGYHLGDISPS